MFPDLRGVMLFALIGMIASAVAAIGGLGLLIWFIVFHVRVM